MSNVDDPDNSWKTRTDEVKLIKTDSSLPGTVYTGRAIGMTAADTDSVWQISRTLTQGTQSTKVFMDMGKYTQKWSNRNVLNFPPSGNISFANSFSINLDGINDYMQAASATFFQFSLTDAFSFTFFYKVINTGISCLLFQKSAQVTGVNGYQALFNTAGQVMFDLHGSTLIDRACIQTTGDLRLGHWAFLALTKGATTDVSGMNIYLGYSGMVTLLPVTTISNSLITGLSNASPFTWGANTNGAGARYAGFFDEWGIWGAELGVTAITALYNSGMPTNLAASPTLGASLLAWYRWEDPSQFPKVTDSWTNGYGGTMFNMVSGSFSSDVSPGI